MFNSTIRTADGKIISPYNVFQYQNQYLKVSGKLKRQNGQYQTGSTEGTFKEIVAAVLDKPLLSMDLVIGGVIIQVQYKNKDWWLL